MSSSTPIPDSKAPIFAIVGPTASGKSGLAMRIAQEFDGEIIAADSQTVKRGLDIGTAKPTGQEQATVKHHLIDVIDPYERFTAGEFKRRAEAAISDIQSRGKLPILVGGSGMYIDSVLHDFTFRKVPREELRAELESRSVEELQELIRNRKLVMPENSQNKRHLVRTLETDGQKPERGELRSGAVVVGINPKRELLIERINQRVDAMLANGFLTEVDKVIANYGEPPADVDSIGYRIALAHRSEDGEYDAQAIAEKFKIADRQYAKRQLSWFKRSDDITWFEHADEAHNYLFRLLSNDV